LAQLFLIYILLKAGWPYALPPQAGGVLAPILSSPFATGDAANVQPIVFDNGL